MIKSKMTLRPERDCDVICGCFAILLEIPWVSAQETRGLKLWDAGLVVRMLSAASLSGGEMQRLIKGKTISLMHYA
jgi:hypothetical protein